MYVCIYIYIYIYIYVYLIRAMVMEAARFSETSVDIELKTRQYIPEDSELKVRCPLWKIFSFSLCYEGVWVWR
jgi:hypothetical protein